MDCELITYRISTQMTVISVSILLQKRLINQSSSILMGTTGTKFDYYFFFFILFPLKFPAGDLKVPEMYSSSCHFQKDEIKYVLVGCAD